ncbi:hypothetical protein BYT27DRAFT_7212388 [Phlegmacium glaucopus]|nr:hypothetical protein BYT27DRAFT_7212388 [Phlegmacium glaucopus]
MIAKVKPPTALKRKEPDNKAIGPVIKKHAKKTEGGLLSGWSNKLAKERLKMISARNASSRKTVEDQDDPLEYAGGEFDEDEPIESVRAACDGKKPVVSIQGNRATTVRIVETVIPEIFSSCRRVKKMRYNFSSPPFPRGAASTSYAWDWRKSFKLTLIHWATTLEDPFGTNTVMEDIVTDIWKVVFPSIANEVDGGSREAIIHMAADALIDWHSSMEGVKKEDAQQAAKYYLENYRLIYQNPDDNTGNRGAFLSPLVSMCLAVHLKKTENNVIQYGYPVGALAIATAVLECGLELIKAGHIGLSGNDTDIFDDDAPASKKRKTNRYTGYTDAAWGGKTRGWAAAANRLDNIKWRVILHTAVDKMDWSVDDGEVEEGTGGGALDPHSLIEIYSQETLRCSARIYCVFYVLAKMNMKKDFDILIVPVLGTGSSLGGLLPGNFYARSGAGFGHVYVGLVDVLAS